MTKEQMNELTKVLAQTMEDVVKEHNIDLKTLDWLISNFDITLTTKTKP